MPDQVDLNACTRTNSQPIASILRGTYHVLRKLVTTIPLMLSLVVVTGVNSYSQVQGAEIPGEFSNEFVGGYLNPGVFSELEVQLDDGRSYVQIDDMRMRVDALKTFGYTGRKWFEGRLVYEFESETGVRRFSERGLMQLVRNFPHSPVFPALNERMLQRIEGTIMSMYTIATKETTPTWVWWEVNKK